MTLNITWSHVPFLLRVDQNRRRRVGTTIATGPARRYLSCVHLLVLTHGYFEMNSCGLNLRCIKSVQYFTMRVKLKNFFFGKLLRVYQEETSPMFSSLTRYQTVGDDILSKRMFSKHVNTDVVNISYNTKSMIHVEVIK